MTPLPELVKRIDEALKYAHLRAEPVEIALERVRRDLRELVDGWPPQTEPVKEGDEMRVDFHERNSLLAALEPLEKP